MSTVTVGPEMRISPRRGRRRRPLLCSIFGITLALLSTPGVVTILENNVLVVEEDVNSNFNPMIGSTSSSLTVLAQGVHQPPGVTGEWPTCIEHNTVIRNAGQSIFTNVQGYGAVSGCFMEDCKNTDKFAVL
jgi:hypothetical protein